MHFINELEGYRAGIHHAEGFIKHTTDGGLTWNVVELDTFSPAGIFSLDFVNDGLAYAAGAFGVILKMDNSTSIKSPNSSAFQKLQIHPNPVHNTLYLTGNNDYQQLEVFDTFGRLVLKAGNVRELDCSALIPGSYIVKAWNNAFQQQLTARFIKL